MSKNFGVKGGELNDTPRPGLVLSKQRAATLSKYDADLYLWLVDNGPATLSQVQDQGFSILRLGPLMEKGYVMGDIHTLTYMVTAAS